MSSAKNASIPVVEAWNMQASRVDMLVGFSYEEAGAAAAQYLADKGYRNLGYVGSAESRSAAGLAGFQAAASECGLPVETITLTRAATIADS
jgi:LacI family gluconate utilization system Gnt-I transcriptional repressor